MANWKAQLAMAFRQLRQCPCGKVRHETQSAAAAHADHLKRAINYQTQVYFHHVCDGWHVGSDRNNYRRILRRGHPNRCQRAERASVTSERNKYGN